jgi:hypothetical protein
MGQLSIKRSLLTPQQFIKLYIIMNMDYLTPDTISFKWQNTTACCIPKLTISMTYCVPLLVWMLIDHNLIHYFCSIIVGFAFKVLNLLKCFYSSCFKRGIIGFKHTFFRMNCNNHYIKIIINLQTD